MAMVGRHHWNHPAIKPLLLLAVFGLLLGGGAVVTVSSAPRAQERIDLAQELQPIGALTIAQPVGASLSLTAAAFALAPGQTTLPMTNRSEILVVIQSGSVRLLSDRAPSRTFQGGSEALGGIDQIVPGLAAQADNGLQLPPDPLPDGTFTGNQIGDADRWYSLPQGFAFNVEPNTRLQFRGITQAQVLIISVRPEAAWS
jgi:hypothetical protein